MCGSTDSGPRYQRWRKSRLRKQRFLARQLRQPAPNLDLRLGATLCGMYDDRYPKRPDRDREREERAGRARVRHVAAGGPSPQGAITDAFSAPALKAIREKLDPQSRGRRPHRWRNCTQLFLVLVLPARMVLKVNFKALVWCVLAPNRHVVGEVVFTLNCPHVICVVYSNLPVRERDIST